MFQKIQKLWIIVKFFGNRDVIVGYANKSGYKLPLLCKDCTEVGLADCQGVFNFLHKAVEFYDVFEHHPNIRLSKADQYMRLHFASKWNIKRNVYRYVVAEQKKLLRIFKNSTNPVNDLRNRQIALQFKVYS